MSVPVSNPTEIQLAFESFQKTRFYQWLDQILLGKYKWVILPITGLADAFVVVIPTEAVMAMYMMRHPHSRWWLHTIIVSVFAGFGYVLLSLIVASFGIDAVSWMTFVAGSEISNAVGQTITSHLLLFGITAGITSLFPMPATAYAITVGLLGAAWPPMFVGIVLGKCVRFGIFAYGAQRWGLQVLEYYLKHSTWMTVVIMALLLTYLVIQ